MNKKDLAFARKKRLEWEGKSEKYRRRYGESSDPKILAQWFKASAFALKADWFNEAIQRLRMNNGEQTIKKIFSLAGRGSRQNPTEYLVKNMLLMFKIDKLVEEGATKTEAFSKVAGDYFKTGGHRGFASIKNAYYAAKRHKPEIYVEENAESICISAFPAVTEVTGVKVVGTWKLEIKK